MSKQIIVKRLLDYGREQNPKKSEKLDFTGNRDADNLILSNTNAFLFGVLLDEGWLSERCWSGPYLIRERLGHLDPKRIAIMSEEELSKIFALKPAIHFYYNTAAKRIRRACQLLIKKYNGQAQNIWNDNPRADDLEHRFDEFYGVGQKKASMAVNILVRDLGVPAQNKEYIDVSDDRHVRLVFQRTGLMDTNTQEALLDAARNLSPDYPGALDLPAWLIGKKFCRPEKPKCTSCPLGKDCPKVGV